jgi:hypothetical protein
MPLHACALSSFGPIIPFVNTVTLLNIEGVVVMMGLGLTRIKPSAQSFWTLTCISLTNGKGAVLTTGGRVKYGALSLPPPPPLPLTPSRPKPPYLPSSLFHADSIIPPCTASHHHRTMMVSTTTTVLLVTREVQGWRPPAPRSTCTTSCLK